MERCFNRWRRNILCWYSKWRTMFAAYQSNIL
nr:MAG TPA: hypothetical protein [Crassvirales sp.]